MGLDFGSKSLPFTLQPGETVEFEAEAIPLDEPATAEFPSWWDDRGQLVTKILRFEIPARPGEDELAESGPPDATR